MPTGTCLGFAVVDLVVSTAAAADRAPTATMMLQQTFGACGKNDGFALGPKMQSEMLVECRSGGLHVVLGRSQIGSRATAACTIVVGDKLESTTKLGFRSHRCVELKSSRSCWRVHCELRSGEVASGQMDTQTDSHPSSTEKQQDNRSFASSSQPCLPGIIYPPLKTVGKSTNIFWQECMVKKPEREKMLGQKGCVVWITGLSASGKSTLACTLDHALLSRGRLSYVLDGDNLRHGLNNNLGFSAEDRAENIRRVGEVAKLFADAGLICIASFISPYRKDRDSCRQLLPPGDFIEVYLKVPLNICEKRDPKGLYKLARAGKIKGFTGIDDPYEEPQNCEIVMEMKDCELPTPSEMAAQVIAYLEERGYLAPNR